ncbi:MAG TPA: radical SAM family heme chaperone HemW [Aequorivita sp.]|nr:radical SAM family heme chaperone HemW [Aequorivita sp.]
MKLQNPETVKKQFGIYLHIPFCKQACHYCNYHFSTKLKRKGELVDAICKELLLRKNELTGIVETIYFGGGTPSLLTSEELKQIFETIFSNYNISENPEITLEANPDDLTPTRINELAESPINRLSIGVQSFFEEDLKLMNRAHNSTEALESIKEAKKHFENISIDLIYGVPGMSEARWMENLNIALGLNVPHISCYALTVEPKTALETFIEKGVVAPIDEDAAEKHYETLLKVTEQSGYENYEFSNFGKPGFRSRNNTAYWEEIPFIGIGPGAHSYDGGGRSWNVENNIKYIKGIQQGELPSDGEVLTTRDKYNEYVMTGLRTSKGVSLKKIEQEYGEEFLNYLMDQARIHLKEGFLLIEDNTLKVTPKSRFIRDGIASELFWV